MATATHTIDPLRFAEALETLPLDALHAKAAEVQNSMSHLRSSNDQMLPFAEDGDADCREAMFENLGVIGRMTERVNLIRAEVEKRGMPWPSDEREAGVGASSDGEAGEAIVAARPEDIVNGEGRLANGDTSGQSQEQSGRLTDDELRRRVEAQMAGDQEEEGVHL